MAPRLDVVAAEVSEQPSVAEENCDQVASDPIPKSYMLARPGRCVREDQRKWYRLPRLVMQEILVYMFPLHGEQILSLRGSLEPLLCFVLNEHPRSAVPSLYIEKLKQKALARQREVGIGFESIIIANHKVDWSSFGFFQLCPHQEGLVLRHTMSGAAVRLPDNLQNEEVHLRRNDSFRRARVCTHKTLVDCLLLFSDAGVKITKGPRFLV